jgi:Tfp pilus assembly protein PilF
MRNRIGRILLVAAAGGWLAACTTTGEQLAQSHDPNAPFAKPGAGDTSAPAADTSGVNALASADPSTVPPVLGVPPESEVGLLGGDPQDDLSLGKKQYLANNFGLAEKHFRRAVELHPRDAEAWLGLAASYDRLRRFDLADRAYKQAIGIVGPTVVILNNQGFSYMLRGDFRRAREKLNAAAAKEPGNKYVENNLKLLADAQSKGKSVQ